MENVLLASCFVLVVFFFMLGISSVSFHIGYKDAVTTICQEEYTERSDVLICKDNYKEK